MRSDATLQPDLALGRTADDWVIRIRDLAKMYTLYDQPAQRLLEPFRLKRQPRREFWCLRSVNLEIRRGEIVGLIGRNGSGKSTLLQMLAGVLRPTRGQIELRGRVAALLELGSGFNPEFTGRENINLNAAILGLSRRETREKMDAIVAFADIGQFVDQPVKRYSSGMYVRLAFAIATHVDADILLVDEALAVGDSAFQFKCLHRLEELLERGTTIVLVTHDMELIKSYCDRAVYLQEGQVVCDGDCERVTERYLLELRDAEARQLNQRILEKGSGEAGAAGEGLRFGSDRGVISSVSLGSGAEPKSAFGSGERVWVRIEATVIPDVKEVTFQVQVRDLRGLMLYGLSSRSLTPDAAGRVRGEFSFDCNLQQGDYSLSIRLGEVRERGREDLIEKQVNAAIFGVARGPSAMMGICDLNGSFQP